MFNTNFAKIFLKRERSTNYSMPNLTDTNGGVLSVSSNMATEDYAFWRNTTSGSPGAGNRFKAGTGVTPATKDDYNLSNVSNSITSSFTINVGYDENGSPYAQYAIIFNNTSNSDVTITEIGFFKDVSSDSTPYLAMIWRKVLEEPITIPAGTSFNYNIKWSMNMN